MRAIGDYDEEDNWAPNFATINMPGNGIQPGPGGQQVMAGQGLLIPPVTNQVLWTWAYKLVSNNPTLENVVSVYAFFITSPKSNAIWHLNRISQAKTLLPETC